MINLFFDVILVDVGNVEFFCYVNCVGESVFKELEVLLVIGRLFLKI